MLDDYIVLQAQRDNLAIKDEEFRTRMVKLVDVYTEKIIDLHVKAISKQLEDEKV